MRKPDLWLLTAISLVCASGQGCSEPPSPAPSPPPVIVRPAAEQQSTEMGSRDQPFGFSMGMSKDDLQRTLGTSLQPVPRFPHMFEVRSAPKPDDYFNSFAVLIGPHSGLCELLAVGPDLAASDVGSTFSIVRSKLDRVYGGTHMTDSPPFGVSARRPRPAPKNPETLSAKWSAATGSNMGTAVDSVTLGVSAGKESSYHLKLQFFFNNAEQCIREF